MKSRKLGIALLVMLAFVVTTGTFAYWASGVSGNSNTSNASVTIGTGETITTTVTISAESVNGTALVPTSRIAQAGDDTATVTFPVQWDADSGTEFDGTSGTLAATVSNVQINGLGATRVAALFSVTVTSGTGAVTEGSPTNVVVTVVFQAEPQDLAEYNIVAGQNLTFDIEITVTPA